MDGRQRYDSSQDTLFDLAPAKASQREPAGAGRPRLQRPNRDQIELSPIISPESGASSGCHTHEGTADCGVPDR